MAKQLTGSNDSQAVLSMKFFYRLAAALACHKKTEVIAASVISFKQSTP